MGCTHFFWMTPHASCPSESHERAGWDGRRKRLGLAGATGCPGKRRAPQAARGGTGCPGEEISFARFFKKRKISALILFGLPSPRNCSSKSTQSQPCGRHRLPGVRGRHRLSVFPPNECIVTPVFQTNDSTIGAIRVDDGAIRVDDRSFSQSR